MDVNCVLLFIPQDHIVSATLLTKRDTFLTKTEFQHLLFAGIASRLGGF
jgi:hypothetical protein